MTQVDESPEQAPRAAVALADVAKEKALAYVAKQYGDGGSISSINEETIVTDVRTPQPDNSTLWSVHALLADGRQALVTIVFESTRGWYLFTTEGPTAGELSPFLQSKAREMLQRMQGSQPKGMD